jgi:hypothetical protein
MSFRPFGENGHDSAAAELHCFLDGPLHTIEFEDAQQQSDGKRRRDFQLVKQCEVDAVAIDGCDAGEPGAAAGDHVKLHAWLGAEHAAEMLGLIAAQRCSGVVPGVCDPAAARHEKLYRVLGTNDLQQKHLGGRLPASPESVAWFRLSCLLLLRCLLCRLLGRLLGCLLCCHGFYSPLSCNTDVAVTECIE